MIVAIEEHLAGLLRAGVGIGYHDDGFRFVELHSSLLSVFPVKKSGGPPTAAIHPRLVGAAIHPNTSVIGLYVASVVVGAVRLLAGGVVIIAETATRQPNNSSWIH